MVTLLLFILMTFSIVILIAGMRFAIERCEETNRDLNQHAVALQQQTVALGETVAEERLTLTAAELQHRTRNLISAVGTIADNTLRTSRTFEEFKARYHGRLLALGRAQGLLSHKREGRVTFDELLNAKLSAQSVREGENGSLSLEGPQDIPLRSGTVQTLAMVMHELVANAVKYGALKQPNGHLTVRWRLETRGEGDRPWLHLD
jgi:two-component system, chemotaxis family, CheB/CheR fusion protein